MDNINIDFRNYMENIFFTDDDYWETKQFVLEQINQLFEAFSEGWDAAFDYITFYDDSFIEILDSYEFAN